MANLLDNIENSVWHAFDYLALEGDGTAQKSRLKVRFERFDWLLNMITFDVLRNIANYLAKYVIQVFDIENCRGNL